jgi:plastocyanin
MRLIPITLLILLAIGCTQEASEGNRVEITSSGFSPEILKIKPGDTVTFVNKDSNPHWPASNVHPTHMEYPEPGGCIGSSFDACGPLNTGETFSFTFSREGTWRYHDHLNSGLTGTIIVE